MADSLATQRSFAGGPGGKSARLAPLVPSLQVRARRIQLELTCLCAAVQFRGEGHHAAGLGRPIQCMLSCGAYAPRRDPSEHDAGTQVAAVSSADATL